MADFIFNIAKGKVAYYATLPAATDALTLVLLVTAGLEADDTLNNYTNLSTLLAATNDEATFTGYSRKVLSGVVVTVDNTANRADVDAADPTAYTASGAAQAVSKAIICYDPAVTSADTALIPLVALDCVVTFDVGIATTLSFNAAGFARAA